MTNSDFCKVIKESFLKCYRTSPRSNEKLKILHGAISRDLKSKMRDYRYTVVSLGFALGKEYEVEGKYNKKAVDITILKNNSPIAGIAVKFVMSNYSQNSNNYFENMMGETVNIRSMNIPYYQVFIIPEEVPYYDKDGSIKKWETISGSNISKYVKLSDDDVDSYLHAPNKMLIYIVSLDCLDKSIPETKREYAAKYNDGNLVIRPAKLPIEFGETIIYNDWERFSDYIIRNID